MPRNVHAPDETLRTLAASFFTATAVHGSRRMRIDDLDWDAVSAAVRARMNDLMLSQRAVADAAGISEITLRHVLRRTQDAFERDTLVQLSRALGWGREGLLRIGKGEDPADVEVAAARTGQDHDTVELLLGINEQVEATAHVLETVRQEVADINRRLSAVEQVGPGGARGNGR